MNKMNIFFLFVSCIGAVIADMLFVYWAKSTSHQKWIFFSAYFLSSCCIILWSYTMKLGLKSANAIAIYALFTMAGCTLLGYYLFSEQLSLPNWIGLFLAAIAIILISI